jgi:methionyl-tRNA synthetase
MGDLLEACRVVSLAAAPFMPAAAERAHRQLGLDYEYATNGGDGPALAGQATWGALGGGGRVGAQEILFPRVEIEATSS